MSSDDVRERELKPLMKVNDNYEKIVLSLGESNVNSYGGIKWVNLINWLIE